MESKLEFSCYCLQSKDLKKEGKHLIHDMNKYSTQKSGFFIVFRMCDHCMKLPLVWGSLRLVPTREFPLLSMLVNVRYYK